MLGSEIRFIQKGISKVAESWLLKFVCHGLASVNIGRCRDPGLEDGSGFRV